MSSVDTSIGQGGTFANGPASPVQPPGMGITTVPTFLSPGASLSAAFTSGTIVALGSFPPAGPIDGQQAILELPSTYDPVGGKKIRWAFAYNASDAVWDFIGGPPLYAEVLTAETPPAAYGDMATIGPQITLPRPGDFFVDVGAQIQTSNLGAAADAFMAYQGAGVAAASDNDAAMVGGNYNGLQINAAAIRRREKTGLTLVSALTAKYKLVGGNAATIQNRWMTVTPVRIT